MEDNFLLESIAACPDKQSALTIYFTVNTVFMHYFDSLTKHLKNHILQNWKMHEQVLPISLQICNFDSKVLEAPMTLNEFVHQYQKKKQVLDNKENSDKVKHSFLDNYIMDISLFIATILSMIATEAIVCIICNHIQMKALLTGIAFQPVKQTDAIFGSNNENEHCKCTAQCYMIAALASMIIGLIIFILITIRKCRIFRAKLFSNTVTVMLFFSDIKQ